MFSRHERVNPLIARIETVFYNDLSERFIDIANLTANNLDEQLLIQIQTIILTTLHLSKNNDNSITLNNGLVINEKDCPTVYLMFFQVIKRLNRSFSFNQDTTLDALPLEIANEIGFLASLLMSTDGFQKNLVQLKTFILESMGINPSTPPLDDSVITTALIRETFYNEMVNQTLEAIHTSLISLDDLKDEESFIYFALPALTLLEAIDKSKNCSGIKLLGDKVVHEGNCPQEDNFPYLLAILLDGKASIKDVCANDNELSIKELETIKQLCLNKHDNLSNEITTRSARCAAIINNMSSQISQRQLFHSMFPLVRQVCLETLEPTANALTI